MVKESRRSIFCRDTTVHHPTMLSLPGPIAFYVDNRRALPLIFCAHQARSPASPPLPAASPCLGPEPPGCGPGPWWRLRRMVWDQERVVGDLLGWPRFMLLIWKEVTQHHSIFRTSLESVESQKSGPSVRPTLPFQIASDSAFWAA